MKFNLYIRKNRSRSRQEGYILIVMMLFLTLLAIGMTAGAPALVQRIRRERERELIHRGTQYVRAFRLYYRKFGRYPVRLEDLENTNNIRFLRKRYKDPMTAGGEWRLIHYGEAQLTVPNAGPVLPGATTPAGLGVAGAGASSSFASTFSLSSQPAPGQTGATGAPQSSPTDSSSSGAQPGQVGTAASQLSSPLGRGPTFGGGPIVGVASTSKKESIKMLNNKNHYNEWEFVYDPRFDLTAQPIGQQNPVPPGAGTPGFQPGPASPGIMGMQPTKPQ